MALLSQALHLGYLLSPHRAFQGHAAHTARWPTMLSPNGSSDTCISDGVFHIPMPCFHGALPGTNLAKTSLPPVGTEDDRTGTGPRRGVWQIVHASVCSLVLHFVVLSPSRGRHHAE